MPGASSVPDLSELIWERYAKVLEIKRRVYVLRAFVDELDRVTRGKQFHIRNDVVWNMVLDARDKCIIDIYSLTVEMRHGIKPPNIRVSRDFLRKKGLFLQLRDHYLAKLTRTYDPHPDDEVDEIAAGERCKAKRFGRLFPNCASDTPTPADIEDLCERFRVEMSPLGNDRHKNRAHPHEGDFGQAKMHSVAELEALFHYCEELLEDLSLISAGASFGGGNMNNADCGETAADLVDQILFGNLSDISRLTKGRTRDELYARLHEIDDQASSVEHEHGAATTLRFNDRQFDPSFENWLEMLWSPAPARSR